MHVGRIFPVIMIVTLITIWPTFFNIRSGIFHCSVSIDPWVVFLREFQCHDNNKMAPHFYFIQGYSVFSQLALLNPIVYRSLAIPHHFLLSLVILFSTCLNLWLLPRDDIIWWGRQCWKKYKICK